MRFCDEGLPRFLSGELDLDGVYVGRRDRWIVEKEGRAGGMRGILRLKSVQRRKRGTERQYDDEARVPVNGRRGDRWGGLFGKVSIDVACPVEVNEVFTLTESAKLAATAYADDGEFCDGESRGQRVVK